MNPAPAISTGTAHASRGSFSGRDSRAFRVGVQSNGRAQCDGTDAVTGRRGGGIEAVSDAVSARLGQVEALCAARGPVAAQPFALMAQQRR